MMPQATQVTQILAAVSQGEQEAVNQLLPLVYDELRALAQNSLRSERKDHTLQATALVHEAYLKLVGQQNVQWQNRAHFFALAAQAIRRILVDHARSRKRVKRGGDRKKVSLEHALSLVSDQPDNLIELDEAMTKLEQRNPRKAKVVEMRFFGGASVKEVAEVLGVTERSIERDWKFARAWLFRELSNEE